MAGLADVLKILSDVGVPLANGAKPRPLATGFDLTGQGDPVLEKQIVEAVASYGAQLGALTEVVLALAEGREPGEPLEQLRRIADAVAARKRSYRESAHARAKAALDELKARDPAGYRALIAARGG